MGLSQTETAAAVQPQARLTLPLTQLPELQLIYDTAPIGLAFLSADCRYLQINQRLTEICGVSVADHLGRTVRETVPALADAVEQIVDSIVRTGDPVIGVEVAGQRPDQVEERFWVTYWHPLHGPTGEVVGVNVAAEEITERKRAEAELRASEQQFHTLADAIPQLVWMAHADGRIFWFNSRWHDFVGKRNGDTTWVSALHPTVLDDTRERWSACLSAGAMFEMELPLCGADGLSRLFLTHILPVRDSAGAIYRWVGTHIDISEQRQREAHIRFVVDELSHRTKNLLAVIMAVAKQTARSAEDVPQYQAHFGSRLRALAHSHDLLVRGHWQGASFSELVTAQMKPFREINDNPIHMSGPAVMLKPHAVQNLGLALHELATNASKHGSLSMPEGEVSIEWQTNTANDRVKVEWRESGGPPVLPPQRQGFGHELIGRIVPKALDGRGTLLFLPAGVSWLFEFPVGHE